MNQPPSLVQIALARQRGAALLIFMLVFFMASMSLLLSSPYFSGPHVRADQATSEALAQAKAALLARAAATLTRPGTLPCPDFNDDGVDPNGSCSKDNTIGRLPWKTLGLSDLRDGENNRLWYVLATELRNDSTSEINPATTLSLSLDGAANLAAIVFSPGSQLAGQEGRYSNSVKDYLDGANQDSDPDNQYISGPTSTFFNDRAVAISRSELFEIVNRRIVGLLGADLDNYYVRHAEMYPDSDLETAFDAVVSALVAERDLALSIGDEKKALKKKVEKEALETRIAMLKKNLWFAKTTYAPAPDRQSAILEIKESPAITCTIAYKKKRVCAQP